MKKVALSLLALAVVGAGAFAQEAPALKFGGYLDTGVKIYNGDKTNTSAKVVSDDVGTAGGSYDFKFTYGTSKAGVVYANRIKDLGLSTWAFSARNAYAWFLVPSLEAVKVIAGANLNDGTPWNGLDDVGDAHTTGNGYAAVITPATGFSLGGGAFLQDTGYVNAVYSAGAAYTVPSTVSLNGTVNIGNDKDNKSTFGGFAVTFKTLLDGPLSLTGGSNFYGLNKASGGKDYSYSKNDLTIAYKVTDAFSVQLLTYVYTFGSDLKGLNGSDAAAVSYKLNPSISYVVDPITTVGLGASYVAGGAVKASLDGTDTSVANKISLIEVKPNATFTIDPSTKVLVFYAFDSLSGDDADLLAKAGADKTASTVSIEARYSF